MSNLKMPKISISFTAAAQDLISRTQNGTVLLILRDAAMGGEHYVLKNEGEIPAKMSAANSSLVKSAFVGNVNKPQKVLVFVIDDDIAGIQDALKWAATQRFDWLAGPEDMDESEIAAIKAWIIKQRSDCNAIFKAVLPNTAADNAAIVNFAAAGLLVGDKEITAESYCARIAGLLAGTPLNISATYAILPELTDCARLDLTEQDNAVGAGKLITWWDGIQVRLARAVNSKTALVAGETDAWKKIKIVEFMDQEAQTIRELLIDQYIGKYPNTYDNKLVVVAAIRTIMQELEAQNLIQRGWSLDIDVNAQAAYLKSKGIDISDMSEQELREADTDTHVFLAAAQKPLDAVEDIQLSISI